MGRQDTPVSQHMRALISASAVGNRSSSAPAERSSARVMPRMRLRKTTAAAGWRWGGKSTEGGAVWVRAALSSHMCHAQAARHQICGLLPPSTNTAVGAPHLPCCWLPPPALPPGHRDAWPAAGHPLSASRVCSPVVRGSSQVSFGHVSGMHGHSGRPPSSGGSGLHLRCTVPNTAMRPHACMKSTS